MDGMARSSKALPYGAGAYVLVEALGTDPDADQARFEQVLGDAMGDEPDDGSSRGIVTDAVIARSIAEARARQASA